MVALLVQIGTDMLQVVAVHFAQHMALVIMQAIEQNHCVLNLLIFKI